MELLTIVADEEEAADKLLDSACGTDTEDKKFSLFVLEGELSFALDPEATLPAKLDPNASNIFC